jgi:lipopolysaccharide/colanic/teichoic acid biosynthesis glycosyltransferase
MNYRHSASRIINSLILKLFYAYRGRALSEPTLKKRMTDFTHIALTLSSLEPFFRQIRQMKSGSAPHWHGAAPRINVERVVPEPLKLVDTDNSFTWSFSVVYQDAGVEALDAEEELGIGSELPLRLWQPLTPHRQRLLSPDEVDGTLTNGNAPARQLKAASAIPLIHHPPRPYEPHAAHGRMRHRHTRHPGEATKRVLDIVGALTLALLLSPLLLVVGLALARDRGPIIYSHSRTGRHGRTFGCLKFRTMVPNAEQALRELLHRDPVLQQEWMRNQKLRNDPRVTAIGRFLRRTSLDELPQLWNVLKGDMSLVGPRPVVREEWQRYGRRLGTYMAAKPGVTGLWQVMGRSDSCYRRRVALDSYYVRKRSFWMDCYILLRTVKVVIQGRGAC